MPTLSQYTNVHDTAVFILRSRGYQVWRNADHSAYFAEKNGWDFRADDPCALLGLTVIFEQVNPAQWSRDWWQIVPPGNGLTATLPLGPPRPYESVIPHRVGDADESEDA